jgi:hypothetical protein
MESNIITGAAVADIRHILMDGNLSARPQYLGLMEPVKCAEQMLNAWKSIILNL